ncbi:MAG TPA: ATP-binding domain-containing protein, partial [Ktedonobacteraceae bacterium]|nr:ATP-binding domain-containing protein [Ktedonobacteraceae bacterium]
SILRVGDRVIQQVNDYQREVFNGDLGTIVSIDLEEQEVVVQFAERQVSYDYADLSELALAWAITVHKSQGSEYPVVILPIFMQHYVLLSRNLLYTGLTRAKQLAILVGPTKAMGLSIKRIMDRQRYTALADRLRRLEHDSPKVYEPKR